MADFVLANALRFTCAERKQFRATVRLDERRTMSGA